MLHMIKINDVNYYMTLLYRILGLTYIEKKNRGFFFLT